MQDFSISNKYRKDNNKYLEYYDLKQKSKHVISLDENSVYGYAMSKFIQKVDSNG